MVVNIFIHNHSRFPRCLRDISRGLKKRFYQFPESFYKNQTIILDFQVGQLNRLIQAMQDLSNAMQKFSVEPIKCHVEIFSC